MNTDVEKPYEKPLRLKVPIPLGGERIAWVDIPADFTERDADKVDRVLQAIGAER